MRAALAVRMATLVEIARGRSNLCGENCRRSGRTKEVWFLLAQHRQQVVAYPGDIAGTHSQDGVFRLSDCTKHTRDVVLVRYVVDVRARRTLANGIHDELAAHPGLRHLARTVHVGDENGVREGECLAKLAVEGTGTRVAVRL